MATLRAEELEAYYKAGHTCKSAGYLRFVLMAFVCFWQFGAPEPTGILEALSGFAIPAFFTVGLVAVHFYPGVYQFLVGIIALAVSVALAFLLRKTKIAKKLFTVH